MGKITLAQLELGIKRYVEKEIINKRVSSPLKRVTLKNILNAVLPDYIKQFAAKTRAVKDNIVNLDKLKSFLYSELDKEGGNYTFANVKMIGDIGFSKSDVDKFLDYYVVKN